MTENPGYDDTLYATEFDPEFPDRPAHPDFWRMSAVVKMHDKMCDEGTEEDSGLARTIQVDIASLGYMAKQRAMRAEDLLDQADAHEKLVLMWIDAFTAGQRFEQSKHVDLGDIPSDGNRRQRRKRK